MSQSKEHQLFIKSLTPVQQTDYSIILTPMLAAGNKLSYAEPRAKAEMLRRYPIINQQMDAIRPAPVIKEKPPKPEKVVGKLDFIRDLHWVYETMGLNGKALEEAKQNAPSGGALAQLKRALKSETYADRILSQIRSLEMSRAKVEGVAKKHANTRVILEVIERCLTLARAEAGLDVVQIGSQGHDSTVVVPAEPHQAGGPKPRDRGAVVVAVQEGHSVLAQ